MGVKCEKLATEIYQSACLSKMARLYQEAMCIQEAREANDSALALSKLAEEKNAITSCSLFTSPFRGQYLKMKAQISWCVMSRRLGDYQKAETELDLVLEDLFKRQEEEVSSESFSRTTVCNQIQVLIIRVLKERLNYMCLTRKYIKADQSFQAALDLQIDLYSQDHD